MKRFFYLFVIVCLSASCRKADGKDQKKNAALLSAGFIVSQGCPPYQWNLPSGMPAPRVPSDNCMTDAKVELGRYLFYDKRLSANETMSCASCHRQSSAFSDGLTVPKGISPPGNILPRNSQHLTNVGYGSRLTWINPNLAALEVQVRVPLFADSPKEMGLATNAYLDKLYSESYYRDLFAAAFGSGADKFKEQNVRYALSAFERSLLSFNSPYDKYSRKEAALSSSAAAGKEIFFGENAKCSHCHGGINFTDAYEDVSSPSAETVYHDNGIYSISYYGTLPPEKRGLYNVTEKTSDIGKFKAPSLRNAALTYPYMHDGSVTCTSANPVTQPTECAREALNSIILNNYAAGGAGGLPSNKDSSLIRPFTISDAERQQLVDFLISLTDTEFISNKSFSSPRPSDSKFGP